MPARLVKNMRDARRRMGLAQADSQVNVDAVLSRVVDRELLRVRSGGRPPDSLVALDAMIDEREPAARAALDDIAEGRFNLLMMENACRDEE